MSNRKHGSIFELLSSTPIDSITVISFQFDKHEGNKILSWSDKNDIDRFIIWFKPSIGHKLEDVEKEDFVQSGYIRVKLRNNTNLKIEFDLKSGYRVFIDNRFVYEKFSYQFGHSMLELFELEASKNRCL